MGQYTISGELMTSIGKKGIIPADEYGYRRCLAGGLNAYNASGSYYVAEGVIQLYTESSTLMRRIKKNALGCENGHPEWLPGMDKMDYVNRLLDIKQDRICGHISNIIIDYEFGQRNPDKVNKEFIGLFIDVKPAGELAHVLEAAFNNPKQNLAFSKRTLTHDRRVGQQRVLHKQIHTPITFDHVNEGGIVAADRQNAIGLESYAPQNIHTELVDAELLMLALESNVANLGLEDASREFYEEILEAVSKTNVKRKKNASIHYW